MKKRTHTECKRLLGAMGRLNMESSLFGKAADVETLETQVANLETKLKQAQGGEVSYVDTISRQIALIRFYRSIIDAMGVTIDEEHLRYRTNKDRIWHVPIIK